MTQTIPKYTSLVTQQTGFNVKTQLNETSVLISV